MAEPVYSPRMIGKFLRRLSSARRCRAGDHERSSSQARQTENGWETVCKNCGVRLTRPDRLTKWRAGDPGQVDKVY